MRSDEALGGEGGFVSFVQQRIVLEVGSGGGGGGGMWDVTKMH